MDEDQPSRKKRSAVRYVLAEPTLFVTDAELIRRLGVLEKIAYAAIHVLDHSLARCRLSPEASDVGKQAVLAGGEAMIRPALWRGPAQDTPIARGSAAQLSSYLAVRFPTRAVFSVAPRRIGTK
jgi:hypothetical protein